MNIVFEKSYKLGNDHFTKGKVIECDDAVADALIAGGIASVYEGDVEKDEEPEGEREVDEHGEEDKDENEEMGMEKSFQASQKHLDAIVKKAVADAVKETTKQLTQVKNRPTVASPRITVKDEVDPTGGFKSFGEFAQCVKAKSHGDLSASRKINKHMDELRTKTPMSISGSSGHVGGDAVPTLWAKELFALAFKNTPDLFGMCNQIPMQSQTLNLPTWVNTSGVTGVAPAAVSESAPISETQGVTANAQMKLTKVGTLVSMTDELLRFSPYALENVLKQQVAVKLRYLFNDHIVNGSNSGVNLNGNAVTIQVTRELTNHISYNDITKMVAALHDDFVGGNTVWLINQSTSPELLNLPYPTRSATNLYPAFTAGGFDNPLKGKMLGELLGYPILRVENCQQLGNVGDIILVNFDAIAAGSTDLFFAQTPYLYFSYVEESFRFHTYLASVNQLTSKYQRRDGSYASNIVVLTGTAAS